MIYFSIGLILGAISCWFGYKLGAEEKEVEAEECDIDQLSDQELGELLKEVLVECQRRIHEENDEDEPFKEFSEEEKK